ncbi:hypothetical protein [Pseudomonas rhizophila]|uniref:hypothetical protein n=1 Tax=Pseudomonas rhizophila TaxID=2045200 RepID=UPI0030D7BDE9
MIYNDYISKRNDATLHPIPLPRELANPRSPENEYLAALNIQISAINNHHVWGHKWILSIATMSM